MTIIFGNGSVATLNNVHSITVNNDLERAMCVAAVNAFDYIEEMGGPYEYANDQATSDGSISESDMVRKSIENAGQPGLRDLAFLSGKTKT